MNVIEWNHNFATTEDAAITEHKAILLDFYHPESIICQEMDRDTYSHKDIIHFISEHMKPFRINYGEEPYFQDYNIAWMPTQVFLDKFGRENHRSVGYLGPDEFLANGLLALGKIYTSYDNFAGAQFHFDQILKKYPQSPLVEEALFYIGINRYRQTKNPEEMKKAARLLEKEFPAGSWTKKASPYRFVTELQTI
jgi:thioredoxin-related protein